jgi:hypothetical protein
MLPFITIILHEYEVAITPTVEKMKMERRDMEKICFTAIAKVWNVLQVALDAPGCFVPALRFFADSE